MQPHHQPPHQHTAMAAPQIPNLLSMRGGLRSRGGGRGSRGRGGGLTAPTSEEQMRERSNRFVQQTDTDASVSRISAVNAGYLKDKYAIEMVLNEPTKRLPIINRGTYVRTTAIDELVKNFLYSNKGRDKQIISLGAGTDTRYWRLKEERYHLDLLYHEFDFPSMSEQKLSIINQSSVLSPPYSSFLVLHTANPELKPRKERWGFYKHGKRTEGYLFHPYDLRDLPQKPLGVIPDLPTLLISECCLCYLKPEEAQNVIKTFTRLIPTLGIVLYEPISPSSDFGVQMFANLASRNLYMPTVHAYPTLESQRDRLKKAGFINLQESATVDWLWKKWIYKEEKERIAALEMLDEVEEWNLLAGHYAISWGYRELGKTKGAFVRWREMSWGPNTQPIVTRSPETGELEMELREEDEVDPQLLDDDDAAAKGNKKMIIKKEDSEDTTAEGKQNIVIKREVFEDATTKGKQNVEIKKEDSDEDMKDGENSDDSNATEVE